MALRMLEITLSNTYLPASIHLASTVIVYVPIPTQPTFYETLFACIPCQNS